MTALAASFFRAPFAHRGLHDVAAGRPENSLEAFAAAIEAGYGIELDLQLSQDGQAIVFHDYDLGRLTGVSGPIQQRHAAELGQLNLIGGSTGIPTLPQVLDQINGRVPILIELKDQHGQMGETDGRLEQAVAEALSGCAGPMAVMSFNPNMVSKLAKLAPDVPRGLVTEDYPPEGLPFLHEEVRDRLRAIPDYDRVGASFISHRVSDLDRDRVAELKSAGAAVFCWTVRSEEVETQARKVAQNVTFEGYLADIPA